MRIIQTVIVMSLFCAATAQAGGGHQHGPNGEHLGGADAQAQSTGPITLSPEAIENLGVKTVVIRSATVAPTQALFGKVVPHPKRVSTVGARFNGKVEKLFVIEGDYVGKGEELLRIRPIQVGGSAITITAPDAGYVTKVLAKKGQTFQSSDELIEVSDLSVMLFRGELFDSGLVEKIKAGATCSVILTALPSRTIPCSIESIDSVFRGTPPVLYIYSSVRNGDGALKPNMSGKLFIESGEKRPRMMVPRDAVLGQFEDRFVFLQEGNVFRRTYVVTGLQREHLAELKSGVRPGDRVVVQGQYQLQFAKSSAHEHSDSEAEHGHGHSHGAEAHEHGAEAHGHGPEADNHGHGKDKHDHGAGTHDHEEEAEHRHEEKDLHEHADSETHDHAHGEGGHTRDHGHQH